MTSPKRTKDLRKINRQVILKHLYFGGPNSRVDLSQLTGVSAATVTNVAADLLREGIIQEVGSSESEGGRPATLLAVNPGFGYIAGVDLGETHVQLELFDLTLRRLATVRHLLASDDNSPEKYVDFIVDGLEKLINQAGIQRREVLGVGIGVPGVVERNQTVTVSAPIWKWRRVGLLDLLKARLPYPIFLDNGAHAMTLAEAWFGAGKEVKDLVVILIGTGIGAGMLTEGNLYRGATNSAGEWGHTKIVLNGRVCRCNSNGCVEAYAGAPGIRATLQELSLDDALLADTDQLTFISNLAQAARHGNPLAQETLHATAHYLGAGIANLVNLVNPELILIGGWVGLQIGEQILDDLMHVLRRYALPPALRKVRLSLCDLGEDAICMGAACLVLEEVLSTDYQLPIPA